MAASFHRGLPPSTYRKHSFQKTFYGPCTWHWHWHPTLSCLPPYLVPYLVYHPILYPILSSHAPRSCLQRSCLEPHPHLHYLVLNHTRVSTPNPVSPYAGSVCAVSLYVGMPSRGPRSQYSVSLCVVSLCVVLVCLCVLCCCVVSLYGDMPMIAGSLYVGMPSIKPPCKDWTRTERQGFGGGLWTQLGTDDAHT
jgi:hypothetical protein